MDSTKSCQTDINESSKVASYKIKIQKLILFLYKSNKQLDIEILKCITYRNIKNKNT